MRRTLSALAVLCLGTAPVLLSGTAFAATAGSTSSGGSICGTTWQDVNGDGIRQAAEPVLSGVSLDIGPGTSVNTDGNGHYCFTGLAAGTYTVQANDLSLSGGFGWTESGHDSKVDWTDGTSAPIALAANQQVNGFDVGYLKSTDDLKPVQLLIDINGETRYASDQTWPTTPFHVGDVLTVYGSVEIDGNVADQLDATLTLPAGLTILGTAGGMPSSVENSHQVFGEFPGRRFADDLEFVGATVRVDQPFTAGTLSVTAGPSIFDADKTNDTLSRQLSAVAAPPPASQRSTNATTTARAGTARNTPTTSQVVVVNPNNPSKPDDPATIAVTASTRPLAQTGGSVVGPIVLAAVLLMAAAAAFVVARRRIRASA
ncbi:MAG TPA: SdrD B-like domain-containing protein [Pseudonocardiaceae bacterium]|nr:SdrD B-like domain-containing protein [Pseudonocardiaceae bacterium]